MVHRLVEHSLHLQPGWWVLCARQPVVATGGDALRELAQRAEAGTHLRGRQRGQLPQAMQTEPVDEVHEIRWHPRHHR